MIPPEPDCDHEAWEAWGGGARKCADCGKWLDYRSAGQEPPDVV
jgi:hypothetical protein